MVYYPGLQIFCVTLTHGGLAVNLYLVGSVDDAIHDGVRQDFAA